MLASHYDTNYSLKNTGYVGANDGGSSTGLLLQLAGSFRGKKLEGYSVWLVFFDGEEAIKGLDRCGLNLREPAPCGQMGGLTER